MRLHNIAACVLGAVASAGVPPLAYSAPFKLNMLNGGTQVTHGGSIEYSTYGYSCTNNQVCVNFFTQVNEDGNGVLQGTLTVFFSNGNDITSNISCDGPEYGKTTSVVPGNGNTTISAPLDPSSPNCFSFGVNAPLTLNVSGNASGIQTDSRTGVMTLVDFGVTYKQNFSTNLFSETFYGNIGSVLGPFDGQSSVGRFNERQQVK